MISIISNNNSANKRTAAAANLSDSVVQRSKQQTKITVPLKPIQNDQSAQKLLFRSKNKTLNFGRAESNNVRLTDPGISRKHLSIKLREGGYTEIQDLKSANGSSLRIYPEQGNATEIKGINLGKRLDIKIQIDIEGERHKLNLAKGIRASLKDKPLTPQQTRSFQILFNEETRELSLGNLDSPGHKVAEFTLNRSNRNEAPYHISIQHESEHQTEFSMKLGEREEGELKHPQEVVTNAKDFAVTLGTEGDQNNQSYKFRLGEKEEAGWFKATTTAVLALLGRRV